jgi:plastocyanin
VATTQVTVGEGSYAPANISVARGAVVTWTWSYPTEHTVTFVSNLVESSGPQSSGNFQSTMPQSPGTYNYACAIHGFTGSVLVQ